MCFIVHCKIVVFTCAFTCACSKRSRAKYHILKLACCEVPQDNNQFALEKYTSTRLYQEQQPFLR